MRTCICTPRSHIRKAKPWVPWPVSLTESMSFRLSETLGHTIKVGSDKGKSLTWPSGLSKKVWIHICVIVQTTPSTKHIQHTAGRRGWVENKESIFWLFFSWSLHTENSIFIFCWFYDAHFNIQKQGCILQLQLVVFLFCFQGHTLVHLTIKPGSNEKQ